MTASPSRPQGLLLDTHVWFWHLLGDPRLPPSLRETIDEGRGELWLSPISVWELGILDGRGRVRLDRPFAEWVRTALQRLPVEDARITREVAISTEGLQMDEYDPADRFLAATTLVYGFTLVTMDRTLSRARWLPTMSR